MNKEKFTDHIGLLEKMQEAGGVVTSPTTNLMKEALGYIEQLENAIRESFPVNTNRANDILSKVIYRK